MIEKKIEEVLKNNIHEDWVDAIQCDVYFLSNPIKQIASEVARVVEDGSCKWTQDDPDYLEWVSDCGHSFIFSDYSPKENGMNFCHKCGKRLIEEFYKEYPDEEIKSTKEAGG